MSTIKSIRIATDFSEFADRAARRGALLAGELGLGSASLVHVQDGPGVRRVRALLPVIAGLERDLTEAAEKALAASVEEVRTATGFTLTPEMGEGSVMDVMIKGADGSTLVVVGGQGSHALQDRMLGTTAERIVRQNTSPTLAVLGAAKESYRTVLVPVDLSAASAPAVRMARAIAPEAKLCLLYAHTPIPAAFGSYSVITEHDLSRATGQQEADVRAALEKLRDECGLSADEAEIITAHDYPARMIMEQIGTQAADLVVMGKHGDNRVAEWLIGSVTARVLGKATCDVLVVPAS
ncbi:MAG: universal stress protein [Alcanivorax sp.]|nr:universal stress protein [Alcanivorax sp.]